jgi:dephospho-CoA kinase
MKIVGITGGIGSGKTTVCKIFELLGIPVFYADMEAKKLYENKIIISKIVKLFGEKILDSKRKVNKKKLAEIVFNNSTLLATLNAIIHPEVKRQFEAWKKKRKGAKYVIKEAAIMIESGSHKYIDFLVSVTADKALRIKRITNRDKVTSKAVEKRMSEQISDAERSNYSDAIIVNNGERSLIEQALKIHQQILAK